jgi:hypothetical protein
MKRQLGQCAFDGGSARRSDGLGLLSLALLIASTSCSANRAGDSPMAAAVDGALGVLSPDGGDADATAADGPDDTAEADPRGPPNYQCRAYTDEDAGLSTCRCSSPPPEGGSVVQVEECSVVSPNVYKCCSWNGVRCECRSDGACPGGEYPDGYCLNFVCPPRGTLPWNGSPCYLPGAHCDGVPPGSTEHCWTACTCNALGVLEGCGNTMTWCE